MEEEDNDVSGGRSQSNTVHVMFYYTQEFADVTTDIPGHVATLIAGANTVYENSDVRFFYLPIQKMKNYVYMSQMSQ